MHIRRARLVVASVVTALLAIGSGIALNPAAAATATPSETIFGSSTPRVAADSDNQRVELGTKFHVSVSGFVTGVRFFKGAGNTGAHKGNLWAPNGRLLASVIFTGETTTGWQSAVFAKPVAVQPGIWYTAAYIAPVGRYSDDSNYAWPHQSGELVATSGTYRYSGGYPTQTWMRSNYYVDVSFVPGGLPTTSSSSTVRTTGTTSVATSVATTPSTTTSATTSTVATTSTAATTTSAGVGLNLPRVAWEGGPAYWAQFSGAQKWTDPNVFPIAIWWADFRSASEVAFDKAHGVNTYVQLNGSEDMNLLDAAGQYWIGDQLVNGKAGDPQWVGNFLDDEIDGRAGSLTQALAIVKQEVAASGNNGKFKDFNFSQIVMGDYGAANNALSAQIINAYAGPVSVDSYWYTVPNCLTSFNYISVPVDSAHCQTSSSYGATVRAVRARDAVDGQLKPVWNFIENLNGGPPGATTTKYITPAQLQGAVMDSIINEARGILYFNQSFTGNCQSGNLIRTAQTQGTGGCMWANAQAMQTVDSQIQTLAPVLNTQSYQYKFGTNLDTMLKVKNSSAYIFSMISGDASSQPGPRTFQLPTGITGRTINVLNENRTLTANATGQFTDTFAAESSYHIYQINL